MFIKEVHLTNIKSHIDSTFEFSHGTTAITGSNGAGKTTVIEAIAWVLFDYLNYTKEEFVRRGEKKGSVTLTIVSSLDEREYEIYRDTASGYYVEDPQLGVKVANKKAEVFRFIWQHCGLEPGTDLESLFKHAIGVPQGTFTAIFLDGANERKAAFDRLLKVEEYRQASDKLRDTAKFLDMSVASVREKIARAEGELSRSEAVVEEHKAWQQQIIRLSEESTQLTSHVKSLTDIVAKLDQVQVLENEISKYGVDQVRYQDELETIAQAKHSIAGLTPLVAEQTRIEASMAELREKITAAKTLQTQVAGLDDRIKQLRNRYRSNADALADAQQKSAGADKVPELEGKSEELVENLVTLRADLARNQKFQDEVKNGLCPILSQKCLNLRPEQTLADFVFGNFADVKAEIGKLEDEQKQLAVDLRNARTAVQFASQIPTLQEREKELTAEGTRLADEKAELEKNITDLSSFETQLAELDNNLRSLGDPRSNIRILEAKIAGEAELNEKLKAVNAELVKATTARNAISTDPYDAVFHAVQKSDLRKAETRLAEVGATLTGAQQREVQLAAEIKHFGEIRDSLTTEFREKERLEKAADLTKFIRDTLKEAAPRVARNYVHRVSLEANSMFREITGNAEHTLRWTDDYLIVLEEAGFDRPFSSLSGGEQMAAALSVRLALLKQLTDIRIAFFDEPTTNMDAERRENLAMQISNITNFDQLFVISHDDTFEGYVDTVLSIEREQI